MSKIRLGVIGVGNMGRSHCKNIKEGKCPEIELVAISDSNPKRIQAMKDDGYENVTYFTSAEEMMDSGLIDSVLVAIPHYYHAEYAIMAMKKGLHVMVEKPAGVYTKQAREMNDVAKESDVVFAMMFNQRTNHIYRKAKELVSGGQLGELRRVNWIITNWYRPQVYYDSGDWRATWSGEGGGVLLNQCPHQLDLLQWICGLPVSVQAFLKFGQWHDIEVEDDVTITAEYENGASACFITTTGEFPGTNRLEISGDRGKVVIEGKKLTFWKLETPEREFCITSKKGFDKIPMEVEETIVEDSGSAHVGILQNFTNHILYGEQLLSAGHEGINGLTISNAAFLSDWTVKEITLPMDEDLFYEELQKRIATSRHKSVKSSAIEDLSGTYNVRWQGKEK